MSDLDTLKELYERVKAIQGKDAYIHAKVFRKLTYEMCVLFDKIFDNTMGEKGGIHNPLTHQMLTSVCYFDANDTEKEFAKSLTIFDVYLHQIHKYIETQKFDKITIHLNYHQEPMRIVELEWDDVDKSWMPTLDYIDRQIKFYRDREQKDKTNLKKVWNSIATKYEKRKVRLQQEK